MEDKKLNEQESLKLIAQMIQNTRRNLDAGSGNVFLMWGYVATLVTLVVTGALYCTKDYVWMWGFWGIPVIGYTLSYFVGRNTPQTVKTYTDMVLGEIWQVTGICCMVIVLGTLFTHQMQLILPLSVLLMSLSTIVTGIIIRYTAFAAFPIMSFLLGLLLLNEVIQGKFSILHLLVFALAVVFAMVIPGHVLNYKAKKGNML